MSAPIVNPEIFKKLQTILSEVTGNEPEDIDYTMGIDELRFTPMELANFLAMVTHTFDVPISRDQFAEFDTIGDIVVFLDEELQ